MKKSVPIGLFLLLAITATAQLDWSVTDLRCGDGTLDPYELCEDGVADSRCQYLEEWMEIDTACYDLHCTCLPLVNTAFCGNDRREGVEMCDGEGEDFCDELGEKMNLTLTCNAKCGCDIAEPIPDDYNPDFIKQLENQTTQEPVCGDNNVEGAEQCDPPETLCTTPLGEPGECDKDCTCQALEPTPGTESVNETTEPTLNETEEPEQAEPEEPEEQPGFFARLWKWIVSIFS